MKPLRARAGAAAAALCVAVALAGLAAAAHRATTEAVRATSRLIWQETAASRAELGLAAFVDGWSTAARDSAPIGGTDSTVAANGARIVVTRVAPDLFSVVSIGERAEAGSVQATRVHALLVEALSPRFPTLAALVSRGPVLTVSGASFDGNDTPPPGWSDCPPPDTATAVSVAVPIGSTALTESGDAIPGSAASPLAGDTSTYTTFGHLSAGLLRTRGIQLLPGVMLSPMPDSLSAGRGVLAASGDVTISGGAGEGILIVAGRLRIAGPFAYRGVIVAGQGIEVTGQDIAIYGAILSGGSGGVLWHASGVVRRSTCAVGRMTARARAPYPARHRPWLDVP